MCKIIYMYIYQTIGIYEYIYAITGRIPKKLERVIPLAWKMEIENGRKGRQGEKKTYFCYYNLLYSFLNMFIIT